MKKIFGLILIFCSFAVFGQTQEQPEDLKVGLVLSGGGAIIVFEHKLFLLCG